MTKKLLFLSALFFYLLISSNARAQILFSENFTSGSLPAGWTNDSLGQPAVHLWVFNNPFSRVITGAGFDNNFALFDSDENLTDDSIVELASLTTPSIDITGAASTLYLEVDEQFRSLAPPNGDAKRRIEYSVNAGASWVTIIFDSLDYGYPNPALHSTFDISSIIGSGTNILIRFTYAGNWDWWWALDNMQITSYSACTAPPVPGAATSSVPDVCPNINFDLLLVGADSGPDITYQWQSSPDGVTWTNINGATGINYTISQSVSTYYQCIVTCTGVDSASASVQVTMSPGNVCYCIPLGATCSGASGNITNVTISGTTLNNSSGCDELTASAYTFWPNLPATSANLTRGTAYDFSVTTDDDDIISIWIDYDINGIFEPSEWVQVCTTSVLAVANTVNILIPVSATMGPTRMRVRARLVNNQNDSSSSCLEFFSGESEDYVVGLDFNVGVQKVPLNGTTLYPNPATGKATIFFENTVPAASISVYDHTGRLVQIRNVSHVFSAIMDLSDQSNGIYFIRIQTPQGIATHKLILQK